MDIANIVNPRLQNQVETGRWIELGFKALGYRVVTTSDRTARGELTVVHGPNYAKDYVDGYVVWLDRCWYGNPDEWVSIGLKTGHNTRRFAVGGAERWENHLERGVVELKPMRTEGGTIALDDYQQRVLASGLDWDTYRPHPSRGKAEGTLHQAMQGHRAAICGSGTCAPQAWLAGLEVECLDPDNVVHTTLPRSVWADRLAWAQFTEDEVVSGLAPALMVAVYHLEAEKGHI